MPKKPIIASLKNAVRHARTTKEEEAVAMAIFCEMNSIMHSHEECWQNCGQQAIYRDCARAALRAATQFKT
jgi:hypothetical protein